MTSSANAIASTARRSDTATSRRRSFTGRWYGRTGGGRGTRTLAPGKADALTAETVLTWGIDWENFVDEYPGVEGTGEEWTRRLALALERAWA
ncbi:hypothetical protein AB0K27_09815 [Micromonospora echinospora]|uniref:hypothetical protein n=1 Tax=Micromonospora TaxID=1873 RepID=UPI0012603852|nr:hypothetical protein [Micromonospora sp. B006]